MRNLKFMIIPLALLLIWPITISAQSAKRAIDSPAYLILILQKVKVEKELNHLLRINTEKSPEVISKREELKFLENEMLALKTIEAGQVKRLTENYGQLIIQKIKIETELAELKRAYTENHPEVKEKRYELTALNNEMASYLREG